MFDRIKFIMLIGIPGCGKSTYAQELIKRPNTVLISSDSIREELYGDASCQDHPEDVFLLMKDRSIDFLNKGYNVIYDATNLSRKHRMSLIKVLPNFVEINGVIVWDSIENCIKKDAERKRTVGKDVIDRMVRQFQVPFYDEGFDKIEIIYPDNWQYVKEAHYAEKILDNMSIPHDNPHHRLNVLQHSMSVYDYICSQNTTGSVKMAALYHDCGKPYTKSFTDAKGNPIDIAHYYNHQNVGAWIATGVSEDIYSLWLINNHMEPYFESKYYEKLPDVYKKDIDLLHKADEMGH